MRRWQVMALAALVPAVGWAGPAAATARQAPGHGTDERLLQKVALGEKAVSLSDFCAELQQQTGVDLSASRATADEKVTVFVEERPAREVMREVARLFGFFWLRSGHEGAYRYELDQDLRSQLAEEELRNQDLDAALVALDAEMQKYRPYLQMSFEELQKLSEKEGERAKPLFDLAHKAGCWAGVQFYFHLRPSDRAALAAGQTVVLRPDAPNPDHRLPPEWDRPILESWQTNGLVGLERPQISVSPGQLITISGDQLKTTPASDLPGIQLSLVQLKLNHSELGEVSLDAVVAAVHARGSMWAPFRLATSRSPSAEHPANATANRALRGRPPFDQRVTLRPESPCRVRTHARTASLDLPRGVSEGDKARSVSSADVWEAFHRATGLPIIADFYTRLYPADKMTMERQSLFDALSTVAEALGVRWTKDGDALLCRSTSYFWDKLKEVPNRYLQRWSRDREANGGLPLADFLEMAGMTNQQLDSSPVAEGIEECWGLGEWGYLHAAGARPQARFLAVLTPEQLRQALAPAGLSFRELNPAQQQAALQLKNEERKEWYPYGADSPSYQPEELAGGRINAYYVPADWYVAWVPPQYAHRPMGDEMGDWPAAGRTAAEALAAARSFSPDFVPQEVRPGIQRGRLLFRVGVGTHPRPSPH